MTPGRNARLIIFGGFALVVGLTLVPAVSYGQTEFGIGLAASSLGAGIQAAVSATKYSNVRAGFNAFSYSDTFTKDGINYSGTLKLRSAQITYDQYFHGLGGFHISPGVLLYNGNSGNATANIPGGQSFTLGNTTYYSGAANPVNGTGAITSSKAAPMLLSGFGNLLPRSSRHFGINFEVGVVFQGSPNAKLNLAGTSCITPATGCVNTATDPGVQSNVQAEQTKINNDLNPFKYYPVVSLGFSYKF